jgi:uncharacterized protein YqgV (UPF0045/DUF77 family)
MEGLQVTTDRIQVQDYQTVLDDEGKGLLEFIEELQSLRAQGYKRISNRIRTDVYHDGDGCIPRVKVSKTRLETDDEYNNRINTDKVFQEYRRSLYERLKKEFEE